jgi:hypothetical protein
MILKLFTRLLFATLFLFSTLIAAQETGNSLDFDGQDDFVDFYYNGIDFQKNWTFEAWVKWDGGPIWQRVFNFGNGTSNYVGYTPKAPNGNPMFFLIDGGNDLNLYGTSPLPTNTWVHIAITCEEGPGTSNTYTYYENGVQVSNAISNISITEVNRFFGEQDTWLGRSQYPQDPYFDGKIDEVRIWDESRTVSEINDWMHCELSGSEQNLRAYYTMNKGIVGQSNQNTRIVNFGNIQTDDAIANNFNFSGTGSNWVADSPINDGSQQYNVINFQNNTTSNAYSIGHTPMFNIDSALTIEFMLYLNKSSSQFQNIVSKEVEIDPNTTSDPFFIKVKDDILRFGSTDNTGHNYVVDVNGIETKKWYHVAVRLVKSNNQVERRIYINGILEAVSRDGTANQIFNNTSPIIIGEGLNGKLSNFKLWSKTIPNIEFQRNIHRVYTDPNPDLLVQLTDFDGNGQTLTNTQGSQDAVRVNYPILQNDPCLVVFTNELKDTIIDLANDQINLEAFIHNCNDLNFTYQWQLNEQDIPGANALTYTNANPVPADLGVYRLKVTSCDNSIYYSNEARVSTTKGGDILHFDGVNDYLKWEANNLNEYSTLETWVRFDDLPKKQSIIYLGKQSDLLSQYKGHLRINEKGKFEFSFFDSNNSTYFRAEHPMTIERNVWYHVNISVDLDIVITINNVPSNVVSTGGILEDIDYLTIGQGINGFDYFKGDIDEIRFWNGAVNSINDSTIGSSHPFIGALKNYYPLNSGVAYNDNSTIDSIFDPYGNRTLSLENFSLNGETSNFVDCGPFGQDIDYNYSVSDTLVTAGESIQFNPGLTYTDGTEQYRWFKDGILLENQNGPTLQLSNVRPLNQGTYQVSVRRDTSCRTFLPEVDLAVRASGEVLNFDGENDYIHIPKEDPHTGYTVELWVKMEEDGTRRNIFTGANDVGPNALVSSQLFLDEQGYFNHYLFDGQHRSIKSDQAAALNTWYHIAIVATPSGLQKNVYQWG